jgi:uncharacterized membrane-anchored protein YjiN (DUF445 family)
MNERIRELAGQAKFMAEEDINKQISYNTELKAFAEKFAELIVRECSGIVQNYMSRWPEDHELTKQIKQHFGVEE